MAYRIKTSELVGPTVEVPPEEKPAEPKDAQVARQWNTKTDAWESDEEISARLEANYLAGREARGYLPLPTDDRPLHPPTRSFMLQKIDISYPVLGPDALKIGDVVCRDIRKMDHGLVKIINRDPKQRITDIWVEFNGKTSQYEPRELRRVMYVQ